VGCRATLLVCWLAAGQAVLAAQSSDHAPHGVVRALRVGQVISVDGRLSEEAWARADAASEFRQRDPDEGLPATERTEVRVLYDGAALYVGIRMYDNDPQRIGRRLSNRDSSADADWIQIHLDPLHDHLTGAQFTVSAAGVQRDGIISNDVFTDITWDGVWESAVTIDELGWCAELRLPFSQLRFPGGNQQTWGINISRFIHRKNETAWLELVPRNESGLASRMAHLTGLDGIAARRHVALLPYAASRAELISPARSGDPFNDGSRMFGAAGVDIKWGLTSNLIVDGTVNPDFGQVEVDPAVVNLTAFETFFSERRPFFTEGAQIFSNFGLGGSNNNVNLNFNEPRVFHSRRIGRSPQIFPSAADFVDQPFGATILGAAKLTGKTADGWSIGVIEAVADREEARIEAGGSRSRVAVEPRTNYFVARLQRDLSPRASVGMLATSVLRDLDTPLLTSALVDRAFVVGGDGHYFLDSRRDWVVNGRFAVSHVRGTPQAVMRLQQASQRYFQRPDAPHVEMNPDRTALNGYFGRMNLNRNSGNWQVNASLWGVSPGFEPNDLGFHTVSDRAGAHAMLYWRKTATDRFTRFRQTAIARFWTWNFNRERQSSGWLGFGNATFLNYWNVNGTIVVYPDGIDDRLTRGGPSTVAPSGGNWNINLNTDSRKAVFFNVNANENWSGHDAGWSRNATVTVNFKPLSPLTISTGPSWNHNRNVTQYVTTVTDPAAEPTFGRRYVFGTIDQRQLTMTTRANLVLSPRMSVQLYMQPLLAVGDYLDFRELAAPRTFAFMNYGTAGTVFSYDGSLRQYLVDPDGAGPASSFTFQDPEFNFKSLRVNTVFRWEVRPGSNLYAVWTRQQQDVANPGTFRLGRDAAALFAAPGDDVFLVKLAYWLGR
jgi:hypothetical protein